MATEDGMPERGARVLIVRVGAMGDVLHALPAVAALRAARPDLDIGWVVDPRWAPLLVDETGAGPVVHRLHAAETKLWSQAPFSAAMRRSVLSLRRALRAAEYDLVIDMQGTLRSAVVGRFAGAARFVGYSDPRETAARWLYRPSLPRRHQHVVEQGAALLGEGLGEGLGVTLDPARSPQLPIQAEAERWAEETIRSLPSDRRFVLVAPTAGWGAKQWPAERFGELACQLDAAGWTVLVNAASEADPVARTVVARSLGTARRVCGGVAGLIALTRRAGLVIGGDSGPVHLAAALGTPVLALFGPTDPARNGPWGAGAVCVLRHPDSETTYKRTSGGEAGLARIAVDTVLEAALRIAR